MKISTPKCPGCKAEHCDDKPLFYFSFNPPPAAPTKRDKKGKILVSAAARVNKPYRFACADCLKKLAGARLTRQVSVPAEYVNVSGSNPSGAC